MTLQIFNRLSKINPLQAGIIIVPILIGLLIGAACLLVPYDMVLFGIIGVAGLFIMAIRPEIGILAIVAITSNLINPDKLPLVKAGPISFKTDWTGFYKREFIGIDQVTGDGHDRQNTNLRSDGHDE